MAASDPRGAVEPGLVGLVLRLEGFDLLFLLHREADVVEPVQEAVLLERVDLERLAVQLHQGGSDLHAQPHRPERRAIGDDKEDAAAELSAELRAGGRREGHRIDTDPGDLARVECLGRGAKGDGAVTNTPLPERPFEVRAMGFGPDQVSIVSRVTNGDAALLPAMADELVAKNVEVIIAVGPTAVRTAQKATTKIAIVASDLESDPVASGFISSYARPGGNITGTFLDFPDFGKKWLEALRDALPQLSNIAVFWGAGGRERSDSRH